MSENSSLVKSKYTGAFMSVKVWGPFFLFIFFLLPAVCSSSEGDNRSDMKETKSEVYSQSKEAVEDLLMFWEEKDLFVQSATRNEKSISQVAENITVITAKDIEEMNAHTVAEVLSRVTGVFIDFAGQDFGSTFIPHIQGSADRHVLVMLDGVTWNLMSGGNAETITIPVKIIARIEVIKGPASSAWGSSLGGVINIITKDAGNTAQPSGSLSASYGQSESQDYSGEVAGKAGPVGYYLFAGKQDSDGLRDNRFFHNNSLYSKFSVPVSPDVKLGLTMGYSEPEVHSGDFPSGDLTGGLRFRTFFATGSLNAKINHELSFTASLHTFRQEGIQTNDVLGFGSYGPAGDLFLAIKLKRRQPGAAASWSGRTVFIALSWVWT